MALSNTAVPKYYGMFRDAVVQGLIPINQEIELQMNRIDALIADPMYYYDDKVVEGFIAYCEEELTLTDGSDLHLLDSFKLWAEDIFGWYYFVEQKVPVTMEDGRMRYRRKLVKKRLCNKQYLIVARGGAKTMYASCIQSYFLNIDTSTTHQIATAYTMRQADETLSPIRTSITRARGPLFKFLTEGSLQNTTGSRANRVKLASTKKGIENFLTGSRIETVPMAVDKLQSMRTKIATIDEWLSCDVCVARTRLRRDGIMGDFVKYYDGSFSEAGNLGKESVIVRNGWHPRVIFDTARNRYLMCYNLFDRTLVEKFGLTEHMVVSEGKSLTEWGEPLALRDRDGHFFGNHYNAIVSADAFGQPCECAGTVCIMTGHNGTDVTGYDAEICG